MLCVASAALGYFIAAWVIAQFSNFSIEFPMFGTYSFGLNLRLDITVLAFTVALMLVASIAAGLAPALYASSPDTAQILSGEIVVGGTGKAARRNALVVVQVSPLVAKPHQESICPKKTARRMLWVRRSTNGGGCRFRLPF
jgi:hypothetical protein